MAAPKASALAGRKPKRRRTPQRAASWDVWVVGEDGEGIERVAEATTKRRASAICKAVGEIEGATLEVRPATTTISVSPDSVARGRISKALDVARNVHQIVGATYARGSVADVRLDPISRVLVQHLAGSPKVHRVADALMDLLSDLTDATPKRP